MNTYGRSIVDAGFRFIAFDLRASDNTSLSNTRPVTLLLIAEDIHTIIETLNLQDVTLVGHSQGGKDVIAYEQVYGNEYLHSLCLMDTTPCTHQEEGFGYATRFDSYTKEQSDKDIASIRENSLDFFAEITQKGSPDLTLDEAREAAKKRLAHQHLPEAVDLYEFAIPLIGILICLPEPEKQENAKEVQEVKKEKTEKKNYHLPIGQFVMFGLSFCVFNSLILNMSAIVTSNGLGTAAVAGTILSGYTIGGMWRHWICMLCSGTDDACS